MLDPSTCRVALTAGTQTATNFNSLVWTKDPVSREPWLCVAGSQPRHIKIFDVGTGQPVRTLPGHGKGINDLAISPLSTSILASAAEDNTIRLWNLEPQYEHQPCIAMFCGEGHRSPILAIHFHPNGKWLLSGGIDTAVCLWAVPDLADISRNGNARGSHEPTVIYYPHFFTKELHPNYVDCLAFYGDLIISRAARDPTGGSENEILIWKINGFDSGDPAPKEPPIPVPGEQTRSSFAHDPRFRGFQRVLTLDVPNTDRFYQRFGLLHSPAMRPILAMGTHKAEYRFWDLQSLVEGVDPAKPRGPKKTASRQDRTQSRQCHTCHSCRLLR